MNRIKRLIAISIIIVAFASVARAQERATSTFQSQDVKFSGHGVSLSGTLLIPKLEAGKRASAVLIVSNSGAATRDGVTFGKATHTIYREIAEYFAARGAVVLRYDKRCVGASQCKSAEAFDDYIDDARGALNFLRKQSQVDTARIFLFGHGEGALVSAGAGTHEEEKIAGVILAAMAGRTLGKVLREQIQKQMMENGKSAEEIGSYLAKYDRVIRGLMSGKDAFPEVKLDPNNYNDAIIIDLIKHYRVTMNLLINDPLQVAVAVKAPLLVLQGKKDALVGVKDAQFIDDALKRVYHPDATVYLLDDVDHLLKTNKGPANLASLEDTSRPLDPTVLEIMGDWMEKKSGTVKVASEKRN